MTPFHLAFPVRDLDETRRFYPDVLGCAIGRSSDTWVDFDLFGHQMSAHLRPQATAAARDGQVDGVAVPIPHFGVVLLMDQWREAGRTARSQHRHRLARKADDPLQGRAWRAGHAVHPRPFRQRAGIQGLSLAGTGLCALAFDWPPIGIVIPACPLDWAWCGLPPVSGKPGVTMDSKPQRAPNRSSPARRCVMSSS